METTPAFTGFECTDCGEPTDVAGRCPSCGGLLDATYDYGAVEAARETLSARRFGDLYRYDALLPLPAGSAVSAGAGATPLVDCPELAAELDVGTVQVKDEGRNPTGSVADRDASLAVSWVAARGGTDVALASPGNDGQAVAAAAARAGLDAHVFVPARTGFVQKAMINVHGGDMTVVDGRLPEAEATYRERADDAWHGVGAGETGLRVEARKTLAYELAERADWTVPDAVVVPTGHGLSLAGLWKGFEELETLGLTDATPRLYAAQAEGCAPVVRAVGDGGPIEVWDTPDTICADVEVPDPAAGERAVAAVAESGGDAVATADPDVLDGAVALAGQGVELDPGAATAASGAWALAERDAFGAEDRVVLLGTAAGNKGSDVLRSHLMGQGI
jgi:threonine synthase